MQSKIPLVIGRKGKRQIAALTAAERGATVTMIACMSASGYFLPPLVIFPRKNMSDQLMKGAPPGSIGVAHPSGWVQTNIFTRWFKVFLEKVNPTQDSPALLIWTDTIAMFITLKSSNWQEATMLQFYRCHLTAHINCSLLTNPLWDR